MSWLWSVVDWLGGALVALMAAVGFGGNVPLQFQGYIEGEYVYVASPVAGRLETLHVARGAKIAAGAPLFDLDPSGERPARDDAAAEVARTEARLADLQKG
ncbi:MAG: biotin/lipoyl-binding protein, partial [Geminicoccaceae bacterium]